MAEITQVDGGVLLRSSPASEGPQCHRHVVGRGIVGLRASHREGSCGYHPKDPFTSPPSET
mgnify:CR=1 FL=1